MIKSWYLFLLGFFLLHLNFIIFRRLWNHKQMLLNGQNFTVNPLIGTHINTNKNTNYITLKFNNSKKPVPLNEFRIISLAQCLTSINYYYYYSIVLSLAILRRTKHCTPLNNMITNNCIKFYSLVLQFMICINIILRIYKNNNLAIILS